MSDATVTAAAGQTSNSSIDDNEFVRFGTVMLTAGNHTSLPSFIAGLLAALKKDSRVEKVQDFERPPTIRKRHYFPDLNRSDRSAVLQGSDRAECVELSEPIAFRVRVMVKNQPLHEGVDDVPGEYYEALWDGVTLFVGWTQSDDDPAISAGHVVVQIIRDAAQTVGGDIYVQSCSPGCRFMFVHQTLSIIPPRSPEDLEGPVRLYAMPGDVNRALINVDFPGGLSEHLLSIYFAISQQLGIYADFKNQGRRLIDLEDIAREDTAHLLMHNYAHAANAVKPFWVRPLAYWRGRGWRREARSLIAGLWLILVNMESLQRSWDEESRSLFQFGLDADLLLGTDHKNDLDMIHALDIKSVTNAMAEVSTRLDNRTVALATGWGALGGAVAGGAVGGIIGILN